MRHPLSRCYSDLKKVRRSRELPGSDVRLPESEVEVSSCVPEATENEFLKGIFFSLATSCSQLLFLYLLVFCVH